MSKSQLKKSKQRAVLLENFIENLSRKQIDKCKQLTIQMEGSSYKCANKCMQFVKHSLDNEKEKAEFIKQNKQLAAKVRSLNDDIQRINRVKGLNLTQDQKSMNETLNLVQMLNKGLYVEANRTIKPFPFIQELIQYSTIKKLLVSIQTRQKIQEITIYGGNQYREIRNILLNQQQNMNKHLQKLCFFLHKMDGIQNEEQWVRPRQIPDFIFDEIQNVQTRLRTYRNQIRSFNQSLSQIPSQPSQIDIFSRSTNYQSKNDEQQRQISGKIRQIQRKIKNNTNKSLLKKTNYGMLTQIQEHIRKLQQSIDILSKKNNMNEEQIEDKVKIMSLKERVKQLYDERMKFMNKLGYNMKQLNQILAQSNFQEQFDDDIDEIIRIFQFIVKQLVWQHHQKQKKIEYILKERDNYKNQFNRLNMISNNSEDFQNMQLNLIRSSTSEPNIQDLNVKIELLQAKIDSLQIEKNQKNKVIEANIEQNQFLKKTIRQRQTDLFDIKSEIYMQQKQTKQTNQKLKNQIQKIKQLQLINSQSLLYSQRISNSQTMLNLSITGDFLKEIRQVSVHQRIISNSYVKQQMEVQTQLDISKLFEEKARLIIENSEMKYKISSMQNRISKKQIEIKDVRDELENAHKMLEQALHINASTPQQNNPIIASSIIRSKSQEKDKKFDECQKYISENMAINKKFSESKARINELYAKNLVLITQNQSFKKTISEITNNYESKHESIKTVLWQVQQKLQKSYKNAEKLKETLQYAQNTKMILQKENSQLKSSIKSQINKTNITNGNVENTMQFSANNQVSNRPHLFTAKGIFLEKEEAERLFLIQTLQKQVGEIYQTKFLYSFDALNRVNFHRYIDNHKHLVVIIKTIYGRLIAAYSESEVSINGTYRGLGLLMPLWSRSVFRLTEGKKPVTYDDYFLIFGNSQIRIRSQQDKVFSNFGIANGYFNNEKKKVQHLLGETQRQIGILTYEIYSVVFQNDRW